MQMPHLTFSARTFLPSFLCEANSPRDNDGVLNPSLYALSAAALPPLVAFVKLGLGSTVALAPVVLFFLLSGVTLAWPYVQLAAGGLWGALRGFTATTPAREKCFLTPR